MKNLTALFSFILSFILLAGCASAPMVAPPQQIFDDASFAPPAERVGATDIFTVSPEMKHYLYNEIAPQLKAEGKQQGLLNALYRKDQLKLEYDSAITRTASQAFAARTGNCLSLTIMTSALAKELGLPVTYQRVVTDENSSRNSGIYFFSTHVNLTLGKLDMDPRNRYNEAHLMTIDFFPLGPLAMQHTWPIDEKTIVAMFMNNRAAESLAQGKLNDAYWWVRAGIVQDPSFLNSYNTLGVIYRRHGNLHDAERALGFVLEREPANTQAISNLAMVLADMGRGAESAILTHRLEQLEPNPPYHFFELGQTAVRAGDFRTARDMFAKEVSRDPSNAEFHFWLAVAYLGLGDVKHGQEHLTTAMENSSTRHEHDLYAAKLDRIKAYAAH